MADLGVFQSFIQLCAGRIGQLFHQNEVGGLIGIDQKTAKRWLSILETGFQAFTLRPYFRNFNKRIVKWPKLYFWDMGLACALLGIQSVEELKGHYARGALFENFVVVEMLKQLYHRGVRPNAFFGRDHSEHEVDLLFDMGGKLTALEMKASEVYRSDQWKGLSYLQRVVGAEEVDRYLIYTGEGSMDMKEGKLRSWKVLLEEGLRK